MSIEDSCQPLVFICVDDSEHSKRAFDWYLKNIYRDNHCVCIIHVYVPPDMSALALYGGGYGSEQPYKESLEKSIEESKKIVSQYQDICISKGVSCKVFLQNILDSVGHTICDVSKANDASLIVIGQRGLGRIRRTLFGTVSAYVLHHSHIPVIVVPP